MTEQEKEIKRVISYIRSCRNAGIDTTITIDKNRNHFILNALEEIQQYREIETELREKYHANVNIKELMKHFIEAIFKGEKHEGFRILTNEDAKTWEEYKEIGTVEECREAREREMPKKVYSKDGKLNHCEADRALSCPVCKAQLNYCEYQDIPFCYNCGQKLDWSE